MSTRDRKEQTRRAADATEGPEAAAPDARMERATLLRATRGAAGPKAAADKKGRDARTVRETEGANARRGNQDVEEDQEDDKEEEEEEAKADDLFWKHLVWGAYRSRKRRDEE